MQIRNFSDVKSFLFDNVTIKQTVFKNTFWLALAGGVNKFLKFILFIYVARILGATEYGKFTFALAFIGLLTIFSDLGLSNIITREFAREKEKEKEFSSLLSLKILLGLGTLVLILIGSFFITPDPVIQKIIWILALCLLIENFFGTIFAFLQARQKMEYQSFASIFETSVVTGVGLFVLFYFPSVQNLSYSYLFAALVASIFVLIFFHFKIQRLSFSRNKTIWKRFLLMSWPMALTGMLGSIYNQGDSVIMGYFGQITQNGWYEAAYRIIGVTLIPMGLISTSFFPVFSKVFKESKERLQTVWNYYMEIMILLAIPLMVGGMVLAPKIIDFVFDPSYAPSVLAFQILIIMVGIMFFYNPFYQVLIISDQQKRIFWIVLAGAIFDTIFNLLTIPKFSLYGAAFSTLITHLLIFYLLFKFTLKFTSINPLNLKLLLSFIGAILSTVPMYFVIIQPQIYHLHILFSILIGTLIYSVTFFILRYLSGIFIHSYEKT